MRGLWSRARSSLPLVFNVRLLSSLLYRFDDHCCPERPLPSADLLLLARLVRQTDTRGEFGKPHVAVSLTVSKYYYFGGPYGFDIPLQGLKLMKMNKSFNPYSQT